MRVIVVVLGFSVSDGGRAILCALMLIGRLEIFTVLDLLTPAFWRRNIA
jgi:trk system potassium uptake protein TrkH